MLHRPARFAVASLVTLTTLLAACGDDDEPTSAATTAVATTAGATPTGATESSAAGQSDSGYEAAVARLDELKQPLEETNIPTAMLSARPEPGTTVYFIGPLQIPNVQVILTEFKAAMAELGVTDVQELSFAPGTDELTARLDQAVTDKPDGVFIIGAPEQLIGEQVTALQDAGVAVITTGGKEKGSSIPGNTGYEQSVALGTDAVAVAVAEAAEPGEDVKIVHAYTNQFPAFALGQADGIRAGIEQYCPDTCSVEDFQFTIQDQVSGQIPTKLVSFLQSRPDTTAVFFQGGNAMAGVSDALDTAGIDVFLFSQSGDARTWQAIKDGTEDGVLQQSLALATWRDADMMARLLAGEELGEAGEDNNPFQYLTAETVPPATATDFEPFPDFRDDFKAIWSPA